MTLRIPVLALLISSLIPLAARAEEEPKPSCEQLASKGRFRIYFDKVELEKLVQTVADLTCKRFVFGDVLHEKISVVGPKDAEVTADEFYKLFVVALEVNGYQVEQRGNFTVISRKRVAAPAK